MKRLLSLLLILALVLAGCAVAAAVTVFGPMLEERAERTRERDGLRAEHEIRDAFPETRNHDQALDRVLRKAEALRLPVLEMSELWRASEDFGHYLKRCPGAMLYIGNGEGYPALHTSGYDFNDRILKTAVEVFLALVEED